MWPPQAGNSKVDFKASLEDETTLRGLAVGDNSAAVAGGHVHFFLNGQLSVETTDGEDPSEEVTNYNLLCYDDCLFSCCAE